jgi:hypothetical protein
MRSTRTLWLLSALAVGCLLAAPALGDETKTNAAWEKMKTLVGDWQGTEDGKPFHVSYKLISNGTALMETLNGPDAMEMVTLYNPDGSSLLMTHYCMMGNQPRMRATGVSDGKVAFRYLDAANLSSSDAPHMSGLVLTFVDTDHIRTDWAHTAAGKEEVGHFTFTRSK